MKKNIHDAYKLENSSMKLYIEKDVGVMGPAVFFSETGKPSEPYYVCHWFDNPPQKGYPAHWDILKGDFFCLPFGGKNNFNGHSYECHGPAANGPWKFIKQDSTSIEMELQFPDTKTKVQKKIHIGDNVIYQEHIVSGCSEKLPFAHHPILDASSELLISVSPIKWGIVTNESDKVFTEPAEYHALKGHAKFTSISEVPSKFEDKKFEDCSVFPSRKGFCDLIQMFPENTEYSWTTAVCPSKGYLWFSVRKPEVFTSTVFWMLNGGRYFQPWEADKSVCIGLEDACSCYADGAQVSSFDNEISQMGIKTAHQFSEKEPFSVKHIQGAVRIPENFGKVKDVKFNKEAKTATFTDEKGKAVIASVDVSFLG